MMLRRALLIAFTLVLVGPLAAQAQDWQVRADRSENAGDPDDTPELEFSAMGTTGFHSIGGPAGTFWIPGQSATGDYTLSATFTLNEPEQPHELLRARLWRQRPGRRESAVSLLSGRSERNVSDQGPDRRRHVPTCKAPRSTPRCGRQTLTGSR